MGNMIPSNVQVPAHLVDKINAPSSLAESLMGGMSSGTGEGYPRISIKGSRFRIVEDGTETVLETTGLDVVVVGANPNLSKTWYEKEWSKDAEPSGPDCFSLDGVKPHGDSEVPQNDLCATCPQNAWGSKINAQGKQVKACSDGKRLAVVAADAPDGAIYLLQVTPAALKNLNKYQRELSTRGIPPEIIRTRVSFDTEASFPKLKFDFGGFIEEDTQKIVDKLFGTQQVKTITGELSKAQAAVPQLDTPKQVEVSVSPPVAPTVEEQDLNPDATAKGFGVGKKTKTKAKAKTKTKATPVPQPVEEPTAPAVDNDTQNLADEIAALVGVGDTDDK